MPMPLVKKLAAEKGIDLPEAEKRWEQAKEIAEDQAGLSEADGEDYWKYVVGVFKKSMGVGEDNILESTDEQQPWDKKRWAVGYPQKVREAQSFSDIIVIFSVLFPSAVDSRWEGEYEAAKRFRVLSEEFHMMVGFMASKPTAREISKEDMK